MGFVSFAGRVLFASVFLLAAYQEFRFVGLGFKESCFDVYALDVAKLELFRWLDILLLVADVLCSIELMFLSYRFSEFGVDGGPAAKALKPKFDLLMKHVSSHCGFSLPHVEMRHIVAGLIFLKGLGGLLFIFSSSFGAYLLILFLAFTTPFIYDFYNYDIEKPEFMQLFSKFIQNLALLGALLFYLGMKNSIPKRQKKKVTKAKVN